MTDPSGEMPIYFTDNDIQLIHESLFALLKTFPQRFIEAANNVERLGLQASPKWIEAMRLACDRAEAVQKQYAAVQARMKYLAGIERGRK